MVLRFSYRFISLLLELKKNTADLERQQLEESTGLRVRVSGFQFTYMVSSKSLVGSDVQSPELNLRQGEICTFRIRNFIILTSAVTIIIMCQ